MVPPVLHIQIYLNVSKRVWRVYIHNSRPCSTDASSNETFFLIIEALIAEQDNLVDLNTPVSEYLPEFTKYSCFEELRYWPRSAKAYLSQPMGRFRACTMVGQLLETYYWTSGNLVCSK